MLRNFLNDPLPLVLGRVKSDPEKPEAADGGAAPAAVAWSKARMPELAGSGLEQSLERDVASYHLRQPSAEDGACKPKKFDPCGIKSSLSSALYVPPKRGGYLRILRHEPGDVGDVAQRAVLEITERAEPGDMILHDGKITEVQEVTKINFSLSLGVTYEVNGLTAQSRGGVSYDGTPQLFHNVIWKADPYGTLSPSCKHKICP